ncbi:MAG TPA: PKD domain-containing protein, partial [Bacteroidia bacterium]|nr:PKD domain-containing protein [Bacteroidia bacterium]
MKRLFNILTPCLLMSLFTISCKKEHLTTQTNASPVFYFTGNIGGNAMDLRAGLNNYYMYSSYTQDANNVYNYSGTLKEYNCSSNCPPSIEFIINNYRTESPGVSEKHISDSSLITTYYNYSSPGGTPASFPVTFYPTKGDSAIIKSYTWNFGDGSTSSGKGNMVSIIHVYSHAANYTTSLSVIFSNNSSSSLTNDIQLGNPGVSFYCSAIDSNNAFSTAIYGGTKPYKYSWNFGDSSTSDTSSLPAPVHTYTNTSTVFPVSLIVTDSIGHTTSALTY